MKYSLIHILILPEIIKNVKHAGFFNFNQTEMSSRYGIYSEQFKTFEIFFYVGFKYSMSKTSKICRNSHKIKLSQQFLKVFCLGQISATQAKYCLHSY